MFVLCYDHSLAAIYGHFMFDCINYQGKYCFKARSKCIISMLVVNNKSEKYLKNDRGYQAETLRTTTITTSAPSTEPNQKDVNEFRLSILNR